MSKFYNTSLDRVPNSGGSNTVTIPDDPYQIRGGDGTDGSTSIPCKECWVESPDDTVRVTIGTKCTNTTGIHVPQQGVDFMHLRIPIDDLNKLYFFGAKDEVVYILYRE